MARTGRPGLSHEQKAELWKRWKAVERDPDLASGRTRQDRLDMAAIKQAFDGSRGRYGARKVWHQLRREGHDIARLHSAIGYITPHEAEEAFHARLNAAEKAA